LKRLAFYWGGGHANGMLGRQPSEFDLFRNRAEIP
jgi:hypothetical protein